MVVVVVVARAGEGGTCAQAPMHRQESLKFASNTEPMPVRTLNDLSQGMVDLLVTQEDIRRRLHRDMCDSRAGRSESG